MNSIRTYALLSLLGVTALALSSRAETYIGLDVGFVDGIPGMEIGTGGVATLGYELRSDVQTRHGFELNYARHMFDSEDAHNDELTIEYALATYRLSHYFQSPQYGLYGFLGGGVGMARVRFELEGLEDLKDSGVPSARVFAGFGFAIDRFWRVQASYSRFAIYDAKERGETFLDSVGYDSVQIGFNYIF